MIVAATYAGKTYSGPVELLDLYKTTVGLAGLPPPQPGVEGDSLVPLSLCVCARARLCPSPLIKSLYLTTRFTVIVCKNILVGAGSRLFGARCSYQRLRYIADDSLSRQQRGYLR